ncbi:D-arabinono-1,4-lactone oxidase-domain-containing protein [Mycena metata]|uniref:D-arabinono-1,4-lactone oxidase n=1 Tax=Mycena metata TaxID=1033252 RepID=A0AAD7NNJ1_9AGAR|nr:D-arabinono-1,4-lactone oxidase-domain-containing protein [Mycena metata]
MSLPRQTSDDILAAITVPSSSPRATFINWGRTFSCRPLAIFEPENEEQCELVLDLAKREKRVLRAVGVGHSPSDLACTGDFMLRTTKLNRLLEVNLEKLYVVVQAGITLTDLHVELAKHGLAMRNLGSISDQTLGGIVTTASHGSGITYPVMSADVSALTLLLADGSRVRCSRDERRDLFLATLCGLGATGLILTIQLQVERAFWLKDEQCSRTFDDLIENFDEIVRSAEHVRFWWIAASHTVKCSVVNRTTEPKRPLIPWFWRSLMAFHVVQFLLFLGRYLPYLNTLTGRFVAWLASKPVTLIDDSHTIFNVECRVRACFPVLPSLFAPSIYPQHTTEFALPLALAPTCLRALGAWMDAEALNPAGLRPHFPFEIRFSGGDDIWLSPGYGRDTCWVGIAQYKPYTLPVPYRTLFAKFAAICLAHQGRPHWAKAHAPLSPEALRGMYPRYDDFVRVVKGVDGEGVWRNEYVRRQVFGEGITDGELEGGREDGKGVGLEERRFRIRDVYTE